MDRIVVFYNNHKFSTFDDEEFFEYVHYETTSDIKRYMVDQILDFYVVITPDGQIRAQLVSEGFDRHAVIDEEEDVEWYATQFVKAGDILELIDQHMSTEHGVAEMSDELYEKYNTSSSRPLRIFILDGKLSTSHENTVEINVQDEEEIYEIVANGYEMEYSSCYIVVNKENIYVKKRGYSNKVYIIEDEIKYVEGDYEVRNFKSNVIQELKDTSNYNRIERVTEDVVHIMYTDEDEMYQILYRPESVSISFKDYYYRFLGFDRYELNSKGKKGQVLKQPMKIRSKKRLRELMEDVE
ncbi:uncharacterized protein CANTADRAFT_22093 [Suhomyces tanzawaensis NRRL Y-17324]|uniref:Uncharacterized protein n=1 Tax=Suhomyces tanzawaensis NRRL Y-17324 TaxID=984487 RepID=A0A1E4SIM2_9ASCO|nr:uncharacterized protein CANTADRAFT_22093 [Suhomyces tanzawaensis NRRL Y-17324]ODV79351.1 hypothetical protein CANTADRAFT_22093 [Suhomyces tanzawaensis NRRL Y-17324]